MIKPPWGAAAFAYGVGCESCAKKTTSSVKRDSIEIDNLRIQSVSLRRACCCQIYDVIDLTSTTHRSTMAFLFVVDKRLLLAVLVYIWLPRNTRASRLVSNGPVLTITLKDPQPSLTFGSTMSTTLTSSDPSTLASPPQQPPPQQQLSWLNWGSLRPSLLWSVQSRGQPLPQWLPGWHSLKTTVGYQYDKLRRMPSFVEADLKFSLPLSLSGGHVGRLLKSDREESRGWGSGAGSASSGRSAGGTMDVQVQRATLIRICISTGCLPSASFQG